MQENQFTHGHYRTWTQRLILTAKGFTMGAADIIPGVSGGTIALISGIYEHLITALSTPAPRHAIALLTFPFWITNAEKRKANLQTLAEVPWLFLIFLGTGILLGIFSMSRMIPFFIDHYPFQTYSFFFGLIVFSITIPFKMMNHGWKEWVLLLIFTPVTFYIVTISPLEKIAVQINANGQTTTTQTDANGKFVLQTATVPEQITVSLPGRSDGQFTATLTGSAENPLYQAASNTTEFDILIRSPKQEEEGYLIKGVLAMPAAHSSSIKDYAWIAFSGALAICAMILPGISGAYILVLLGEYKFMLEAGQSFDLPVLLTFAVGVVVGILSFVHLLKFLLRNYHSLTMAALTGFLVGSLGKIWPFRYLDTEAAGMDYAVFAGIAIAGAVLLFILERMSATLGDPEPPVQD